VSRIVQGTKITITLVIKEVGPRDVERPVHSSGGSIVISWFHSVNLAKTLSVPSFEIARQIDLRCVVLGRFIARLRRPSERWLIGLSEN
jgi:hypothetical protein